MFKLTSNLKEHYSPLYFLAALGAGGTVVTFFMYLVFMTPHKGVPIPNFETLTAFINSSEWWIAALTIIAMIAIALFSLLHFRLLFWNIKEHQLFKKTAAYQKLVTSNAEVQLMAIPLTLAMTINILFIAGALFVPNLWSVVEYLFPFALVAFAVAGYYTVRIFLDYATRVLSQGDFDTSSNNNLSQMIGVFAFSMVGVGFSASAAMSHNQLTSGIAMILAILFTTIAVIFAVIKMVIGFNSMLEHGANKETSVSLWIMIPIMTLLGITIYRISMGMHHNFGTHVDKISHLTWFSLIVSVQLIFASIGYMVMKRMGYFESFVKGADKSPASYALVCPGVAGTVMGFFFLHKGLVSVGILSQFSAVYLLLLIPLVLLQFTTIRVMFKLNKKLIRSAV